MGRILAGVGAIVLISLAIATGEPSEIENDSPRVMPLSEGDVAKISHRVGPQFWEKIKHAFLLNGPADELLYHFVTRPKDWLLEHVILPIKYHYQKETRARDATHSTCRHLPVCRVEPQDGGGLLGSLDIPMCLQPRLDLLGHCSKDQVNVPACLKTGILSCHSKPYLIHTLFYATASEQPFLKRKLSFALADIQAASTVVPQLNKLKAILIEEASDQDIETQLAIVAQMFGAFGEVAGSIAAQVMNFSDEEILTVIGSFLDGVGSSELCTTLPVAIEFRKSVSLSKTCLNAILSAVFGGDANGWLKEDAKQRLSQAVEDALAGTEKARGVSGESVELDQFFFGVESNLEKKRIRGPLHTIVDSTLDLIVAKKRLVGSVVTAPFRLKQGLLSSMLHAYDSETEMRDDDRVADYEYEYEDDFGERKKKRCKRNKCKLSATNSKGDSYCLNLLTGRAKKCSSNSNLKLCTDRQVFAALELLYGKAGSQPDSGSDRASASVFVRPSLVAQSSSWPWWNAQGKERSCSCLKSEVAPPVTTDRACSQPVPWCFVAEDSACLDAATVTTAHGSMTWSALACRS